MPKNILKKRKGQLEMMQTVFILIIVAFILIIALIFVFMNYSASLKAKAEQRKQLAQEEDFMIVNYLPEIKCTDSDVLAFDCVDSLKASILKNKIAENPLYYTGLLGTIKFSLRTYEPQSGWKNETIFDNPLQGFKTKRPLTMPTMVYDPFMRKYYYGELKIETYS